MITRSDLERLTEMHDPSGQLISLYLHIDRTRTNDEHLIQLKNMIREVESEISHRFGKDALDEASDSLERIRRFVRDDADGFRHGAAIFVTPSGSVWETVDVPGVFESTVSVDAEPNVAPLVRLLSDDDSFCTCIISRDHARIFLGHMDVFEEVERLVDDEVPGQHDQGGWSQARFERHIEDHVQRHFKHVAQHLFEMREEQPYDRLIVGGPEEVVASFVSGLHPYIKERMIGEIRVLMEANVNDVARASREALADWQRARKLETVAALESEALSNDLGVRGTSATLDALQQGQISTLVVDPSYRASGVRCNVCGSLDQSASAQNQCRYCQGPVTEIHDVVSTMIGRAYRQHSEVVFVDEDSQRNRLSHLGGIGALLRYRVGSRDGA